MNLSDLEFIKLLPLFMHGDEANIALSNAVNTLMREPGSRLKYLRVWDQIDNLEHADLDELAWELNVDWYSTDMSLESKRQTIKYAQRIQSKRGTKWAVEQLISAYFGPGYVKEWFEYGGDPFMFQVMTTNEGINDSNFSRFIRAVDFAKSVRSHIEGVYYYKEHETIVECLRVTSRHLFYYPKCGTRPRTAVIGRLTMPSIIKSGINTGTYLFDYVKCGTRRTGQL